jgi:hypothetical protein
MLYKCWSHGSQFQLSLFQIHIFIPSLPIPSEVQTSFVVYMVYSLLTVCPWNETKKKSLNPLPLLFKALLHGQKDCFFFQRAFNLHTTRAFQSVRDGKGLNTVPEQKYIYDLSDFNVCKNPGTLFTIICRVNFANSSTKATFFNDPDSFYSLRIHTAFEISCKFCHTVYQSYTTVMWGQGLRWMKIINYMALTWHRNV